ncbi:stage III sporulation protein SpoIIIAB [Gorillibacterium sp. sgz5001074]|uniref:stage III sporulation protein SpoIIIAB n=1 Tax=Gorillibacterium sp. sgz5001074 TaxID=3446695 RepID=UPI003F67C029
MLKLIGAVFILFAGTMLGFYQSLQLSARQRQIRQTVQALQRLETEILYGYTPLPEALAGVAASLNGPVSVLFAKVAEELEKGEADTAAAGWRRSVEAIWSHTAMKRNERETLLALGSVLGRSDRTDQAKHLRLAAGVLQAEETAAGEDNRRYGTMWRSLGLLSAVLIVILMY